MLNSCFRKFILTKNILKLPAIQSHAAVHRWVAPTLRELRRREKLLGPQPISPRSSHIEWNYRAEIFAFSKRLQEEFQLPLLQTAFTERSYVLQEQKRQKDLGIEDADIEIADNRKLAADGTEIAKEYILAFLKHELPKLPEEGAQAIKDHLLSTTTLAHIAQNLGMQDLVYTDTYPPTTVSMAQAFLAVIGALAESSNITRANVFVRDFICTQLNQCDLTELWHIESPLELLKRECDLAKWSQPEPRLIGECGKNTILATYEVGIYVDKKLIGRGFGEDVATAINTAALNALQKIYNIDDRMQPLNFQLQLQDKQKLQQKEVLKH